MIINSNISAMNANRNLYQTNLNLNKSIERLSSGLKINSAADDASGLAMVEKMLALMDGYDSAIQNTQDASAFFKIADGAMSEVGKMLSRMEELTVRAGNSTLTSSDRSAIQSEISELMSQIDSVSNTTEYNTMKMLNGSISTQNSLTMNTGVSGSLKVLETPSSVGSVSNQTLSIVTVGSAGFSTGADSAVAGALGYDGTININGVDISVNSSDTAATLVSKINDKNSQTGVVAVKSSTGNGVIGLVTGKVDADAANVWGSGSAAANGSAIGYMVTGTGATISIGGDNRIWSQAGFTGAAANYYASGTNTTANLGGVSMAVDGSVSGSILEMKNSGSAAYGIKIGTNLYNGAYGGYILNNTAAVTSAAQNITAVGDNGSLTTNDANKMKIQMGAGYDQNLRYSLSSIDTSSLGAGASSKYANLSQISTSSASEANTSLKVVQKAIEDLASRRAQVGSIINRLDYTDKTLQVQRENMAAAASKLRDADIALEMTEFTKNMLLNQSGTAMLAQANLRPQSVLKLLSPS